MDITYGIRWLPIALGLLCGTAHVVSDVHISQVDVIERNTVHDGMGRVTLNQFVLWDLERKDRREHVVAWRMVRGSEVVGKRNGFYRIAWGPRIVQAVSYRDRHTQHDVEIDDREYRSAELRRGKDWEK